MKNDLEKANIMIKLGDPENLETAAIDRENCSCNNVYYLCVLSVKMYIATTFEITICFSDLSHYI